MARSKGRQRRRMSKAPSLSQLRHRTADAIARGAFQKARDFAKTLCKQEATAEHQRYLVEATIGRAAQLRQAGQMAEATQLLRVGVADAFDFPELLTQGINELMLAGDWPTATTLMGQVSDADVQHRLETLRADAAVLHGEPGVANLPTDVRPVARSVLRALADIEQGNDAAANEMVAGIPNDSPLYDWKILIQGLTAFYANEPSALELWQQLRPERAPAAIATPFRTEIDPTPLASQPRQKSPAAFARQLSAEPWLDTLEDVRRFLIRDDLPAALRHAAQALASMPAEHQELRNRLARTIYWHMARLGDDEDIDAYARRFDALPEDPSFHRLRALTYEREGFLGAAQDAWASYEKDLIQHAIVSAADRDLARALVWFHMGELAVQTQPPMPGGRSFFSDVDDEDACTFDAIECFRRSVKLAPQHLQAHESLIDLLYLTGKQQQVVRAARQLLQHFPEHHRALEALADDAFRRHDWDEAVAFQGRAVQARPHDTTLADQLSFYELGLARLRAQQGKFDQARAILTAHLEPKATTDRCNVLCRLAAVELKAEQQQYGEELFEQACEVATSRLVAVFEMLIESIRLPVEATWIKKMDREFRRALKAKVDGPSVVVMIRTLAAFARLGVRYDGLHEHQKLILQYLKRARHVVFSEEEAKSICASLQVLPPNKLLLDFAARWSKEFPQQPEFPFAVALYHLSRPPAECPLPQVHDTLHEALELAQDNPAYTALVQQIEIMLSMVHTAMFMGRFDDANDPFDAAADDPFPPDLLDAMADLLGMSFDAEDDEEDFGVQTPKHVGGKRKRRRQRK